MNISFTLFSAVLSSHWPEFDFNVYEKRFDFIKHNFLLLAFVRNIFFSPQKYIESALGGKRAKSSQAAAVFRASVYIRVIRAASLYKLYNQVPKHVRVAFGRWCFYEIGFCGRFPRLSAFMVFSSYLLFREQTQASENPREQIHVPTRTKWTKQTGQQRREILFFR